MSIIGKQNYKSLPNFQFFMERNHEKWLLFHYKFFWKKHQIPISCILYRLFPLKKLCFLARFSQLTYQLAVRIDVKTQKRPTLIMSKSFESADLLSFLAKCIQAPLRGACPTAIAVYTRIVMRLPASKLASAAHTPLCTSQCYHADNRT